MTPTMLPVRLKTARSIAEDITAIKMMESTMFQETSSVFRVDLAMLCEARYRAQRLGRTLARLESKGDA